MQSELPVSGMRRKVYAGTGFLCVGLAVIGAFVPLMPTTIFLILAAGLFTKSSPRAHAWLLNNRLLGPYLRDYHDHRGMRPHVKAKAIAVLWAGLAFTLFLLHPALAVIAIIAATGLGVTAIILRVPTVRVQNG